MLQLEGITPDNCAPLIEAGADFLAVSHGVWGGDEQAAIKAFAKQLSLGYRSTHELCQPTSNHHCHRHAYLGGMDRVWQQSVRERWRSG